MNIPENLDIILKMLYKKKDKGMIPVNFNLINELPILDLKKLLFILNSKGYILFQIMPKAYDYKAQITPIGKVFVEINSFSQPGTSILSL